MTVMFLTVDIVIADNAKIKEKINWTPKYDDITLICKTVLNWEENKKY